jgi:hypothetical protein
MNRPTALQRLTNEAIVAQLKLLNIDATLVPPYEAAVPIWGAWVEFGEPDEGHHPYRLDLTDRAATICDEAGDWIAEASIEPEQTVAGAVALCMEVLNG